MFNVSGAAVNWLDTPLLHLLFIISASKNASIYCSNICCWNLTPQKTTNVYGQPLCVASRKRIPVLIPSPEPWPGSPKTEESQARRPQKYELTPLIWVPGKFGKTKRRRERGCLFASTARLCRNICIRIVWNNHNLARINFRFYYVYNKLFFCNPSLLSTGWKFPAQKLLSCAALDHLCCSQ